MTPLAEQLRPRTLDDVVGQTHLLGPDGPLRQLAAADALPSMILWGPPGCGKTTIARLLGQSAKATFHQVSAVLSGLPALRELINQITVERTTLFATAHIVFVDEIHRWNKAQQDALLPYVEDGTITLIGATTENPSFEIIAPLLSRCHVFVLEPLGEPELFAIGGRALQRLECMWANDAAQATALQLADGDARQLLRLLETAGVLARQAAPDAHPAPITRDQLARAIQRRMAQYDKSGEAHYNIISAFIKSMRGGDADAAVYYLARMYEAGEDPRFLARRMVIFASEDIGNADPHALQVAVAAFQAYELVGQAEGWIPLAQAATYLASAPKSNASYLAYKTAKADLAQTGTLPVPLHLRNGVTAFMRELGYGRDYKYPHSEDASDVTYLPDTLAGRTYYHPPEKK